MINWSFCGQCLRQFQTGFFQIFLMLKYHCFEILAIKNYEAIHYFLFCLWTLRCHQCSFSLFSWYDLSLLRRFWCSWQYLLSLLYIDLRFNLCGCIICHNTIFFETSLQRFYISIILFNHKFFIFYSKFVLFFSFPTFELAHIWKEFWTFVLSSF